MSISAYRVFAAVVEHKSFVDAAERLYLTPSAISHSIAKLEEEVGLSLFHRTRSGAALTADGELLLPSVLDVLKAEERLNQNVANIKGLEYGKVGIGAFDSVCINHVPGIVRSFYAVHSGIEIGVSQGGYADILNWLYSGYADLGFISKTVLRDDLDVTPLFEDSIVCLAGRDFRPANGKYVTAKDVKSQKIVYQGNGYDAEAEAVLRWFGVSGPNRFSVTSDQSNIALVEAGLGICFMPRLVLERIPHNAVVYPIKPAFRRSVLLAAVKGRPLSGAAKKMRAHIIEYFGAADRNLL